MSLGKHIGFSLLLFFASTFCALAQKSPASESDLKRQAEKSFLSQDYDKATPMYSQLLSLYPRDPIYNYRYGICLFQSGKDRTGAATYLQEAAKAKEMDPDVHFYLGRSFMYMDRFNDAISAFNQFIKLGSGAKLNKLHPDIYILNCQNASELRKDRRNVAVMNKQKVNRSTFFASYDFTNSAGKLITTPERFLSPIDKDKMKDPVMFLTKDAQTIYFASYGKKGDTGKDIYRIMKMPDGNWGEPVNLGGTINTVDDEDYPYLDKDGRTLYFSSKAFNSIGGYDIFKSQYDFNTVLWSDPVNAGVPINTVDDDIFYMPSTKGETAVYATAVDCESGKIEVRNIKLSGAASNVAVISGIYLSKDQVTRRDARLTVLRSSDNGVVTSIRTDPRTGEYELVLPAGENYMIVVEGGSYLPHAENFSIPASEEIPAMKQRVVMNKTGDVEQMTLSNYFTPSVQNPQIVSTDKPTEEVQSEFNVKEENTEKMKAVVVNGKTLYVAPPASTLKTESGLALNDKKSREGQQETQQETQQGQTESKQDQAEKESAPLTGTDADTKPREEGNVTAAELKTETSEPGKAEEATEIVPAVSGREGKEIQKEPGQTREASEQETAVITPGKESETGKKELVRPQANVTKTEPGLKQEESSTVVNDSKEKSPVKNAESDTPVNEEAGKTVVSEKTSTVELVKIAFDDAIAIREEAAFMKMEAVQCKTEAKTLDSLSKAQIKVASQLLAAGDKEQSQLLFKQSEVIVKQAEAKQAEAQTLEDDAKQKENEAVESLSQAVELMKEFKVDTLSATYQELKKKDEALAMNDAASENSEGLTENGNRSPEGRMETEEGIFIENAHRTKANVLNREIDELLAEQMEVDQQMVNTTDKKEKSNLTKHSKEIGRQIQDRKTESRKELSLAVKEEKLNEKSLASENNKTEIKDKAPEEKQVALEAKKEVKETTAGAGKENTPDKQEGDELSESGKATIDSKAGSVKESGVEDQVTATPSQANVAKEEYISPEAATLYSSFKMKLTESEKSDRLSEEVQKVLATTASGPERDSLIILSNQLNRQSVTQWQEARRDLAKAKTIEPDIENKVMVNAGITETVSQPREGESLVLSDNEKPRKEITDESSKINIADKEIPEAEKNKNSVTAIDEKQEAEITSGQPDKNAAGEVKNDNQKGDSPSVAEIKKAEGETQAVQPLQKQGDIALSGTNVLPDQPAAETIKRNEAGMPSGKQARNESEEKIPVSGQPIAKADERKEGNDVSQLAEESNIPSTVSENTDIDTTRPEYPQYVEVQNQIKEKQTHTVNSFIEGMQLSKKVDQLKSEEMKLRDQAVVTTSTKTRNDLVKKADALKVEGDSIGEVSKQLLSLAQQDTRDVKALSARSDELKLALTTYKSRESSETAMEPLKSGPDTDPAVLAKKEKAQEIIITEPVESKEAGVGMPDAEKENQVPVILNNKDERTEPEVVASGEKPIQVNDQLQAEGNKVKDEAREDLMDEKTTAESPVIKPAAESFALDFTSFKESEMFSFSDGVAYSEANPIPMDPVLPEGLVFKVQIGAFRKPLPNNTFGKLQPLSGETSRPGWIRYCLGLFRGFEPANLLKKEVRGQGYKDAFVVAYYNGKRIGLYEAYAMLSKSSVEDKKKYSAVTEQEFIHLAKFEIKASGYSKSAEDEDTKAFFGTTARVPADLVEYAVQVGVYKSPRIPKALNALLPVNMETMRSGLYRYTTGRFVNYASADSMKKIAINTGIRDAFIVIYRGGKKVGASETRAILSSSKSGGLPTLSSQQANAGSIQRNIGVGSDLYFASDITFRVQVGAFRENVPFSAVSSLLEVSAAGITQETNAQGLHIFYAGQYNNLEEASSLKSEIASKGVKDAFVVPFAKGKRVTMAEAMKALNRK